MHDYKHTFTHLLYQLYEELNAKNIQDKVLLLIGAQILIHVFRVSCIRGHDLKTVIFHCKEVNVYFFEYMQQMEDSGLALEHGKMASFIYDKVLKPGPNDLQSQSQSKEMREELDSLTDILSLLPYVSQTVTLQQLKDLWRTADAIPSVSVSSSSM